MGCFNNELHAKNTRFDAVRSLVCFLETEDVAVLIMTNLFDDVTLNRGETFHVNQDDLRAEYLMLLCGIVEDE